METVLSICLLVFILGCNLSAAVKQEIVQERTYVSLHCPQSVVRNVTWSREKDGVRTDILTVDGDRNIKHINDSHKYYDSLADKSLLISKVRLTDSGQYFCNSEAAVDLTVVPSGTLVLDATEETTVTLKCSSKAGGSADPTWSTGSGEIQSQRRFYVSSAHRTLKIRRVKPADSGLYYCDGKAAAYLRVMGEDQSEGGKKTETTTTNREETERATETVPIRPPPTDGDRTTTEETETKTTQHTDSEKTETMTTTQPETNREETERTTETVSLRPPSTDGDTTTTEETKRTRTTQHTEDTDKGKKTTPTTPLVLGAAVSFLFIVFIVIIIVFKRRRSKKQGKDETHVYDEIQEGLVCGPNQNDPTYSIISDLPLTGKMNVTSLANESPYSLIEDTRTGSTQTAEGPYFLLQKPKTLENNCDVTTESDDAQLFRVPWEEEEDQRRGKVSVWILHTVLIFCRENSTAVIRFSVPEDHHICLRCAGPDDSYVVWTNQDRTVLVSRQEDNETNEDPDRFLLLSDGSLLLLKLQDSDSGEYRCNERLVAELQVLTGRDFSVSAGRTLLLPCSGSYRPRLRWFHRKRAGGRRELIFTWFGNGTVKPEREGGRLSYRNNSLQIQNLQLGDAGEYLCNGNLQARLTVLTDQSDPNSKTTTPDVTTTVETKKKEKRRNENVLLMVAVVGLGLMILFLAAVCVLLTSMRCRKEKKYSRSASQRNEDTELQLWKTSDTHTDREAAENLPLPEETIHYASLGRQNWRDRPCRTPPDQNQHNVIYSSVITRPAAR
ncbi:hypothetical protein GBF38_010630 [Xyrichtys novacula]|uniref:Ig-like domain-containing protein n=1 Tax=Xyrichtys novacula TaxID=13765 RepID=A0AAV1HAI7_XYRNO|nr:hypothetical protein GBF38_010630 [Xyrichtys novacula]